MKKTALFLFLPLLAASCMRSAETNSEWKPVEGHIMTRWAAQVDPNCPLPEYPRPQMVRSQWVNLNGLWNYAVTPQTETSSEIADGKILVPFAIESALSGVGRSFQPDEKLWYRRTFEVPAQWQGKRVLLHFGAIDYKSTIKVNGTEAGSHEGGNTAFSLDITDLLKSEGAQELIVEVTDPTDSMKQPRGKQVLNPKGIYYTPVSGIWKTVWMEPVANQYISSYVGVPDIDNDKFVISANVENADEATLIRYTASDNGKTVATATASNGEKAELVIPDAKLWAPGSPFLYDLKMEVVQGDQVTDAIDSYFGMRKISIGKDAAGYNRILLNDKFLFQYGFLDQGWWPDGLLTAPTDEALLYDIEFTQKAGYNTIRKHIKVENDRFYYHCDRLGMLVWQDAVSGDDFNLKNFPNGIEKDPQAAAQFEYEWKETIDQLRNYPSIVNWVVFNEGWGQYGEGRLIEWTKQYDPSRLAEVSGWVDMGNGDISDIHRYPGPGRVEESGPNGAFAVGEFGGLGLPVEGHLWNPEMNNWGYATYTDRDKFVEAYKHLMFQLRTMVGEGLSAAIYTQTTDVEGEVNGMMTYDREVQKIPAEELAAIHKPLYEEVKAPKTVLEDSQRTPQTWFYTQQKPADDWFSQSKAPADWKQGLAPFGYNHPDGRLSFSYYEREAKAHQKNTEWKGPDLWIWQAFELQELPKNPCIRVRYDDQVEVFINGLPVYENANRSVHYYHTDLIPLPEEVRQSLHQGRNTIAVHAHSSKVQKRPQSYILDAGIVDVIE